MTTNPNACMPGSMLSVPGVIPSPSSVATASKPVAWKVSEPITLPTAVGVKLTTTWQVAPGWRRVPSQPSLSLVSENPALAPAASIITLIGPLATVPLFLSVNVAPALVVLMTTRSKS